MPKELDNGIYNPPQNPTPLRCGDYKISDDLIIEYFKTLVKKFKKVLDKYKKI